MIKKAYSQLLDHIVENANEEDGQSDERDDHGNNDSDGGSSQTSDVPYINLGQGILTLDAPSLENELTQQL
jgi:hypothetical protein